MAKTYFVLCVPKHGQFLVGKKGDKGFFFGDELVPEGGKLNTAGRYVLPGGRRESEDKDVVGAAVREFEEETGFLLVPDVRRDIWELDPSNKVYKVAYLDVKSRSGLQGIAGVINKNLEVAKTAREAVRNGVFGKDGAAFRKKYPLRSLQEFEAENQKEVYTGYCPHSDELEFVEVWDLKANEKQIQEWGKEQATNWFSEIISKIQWGK